MFDGLEFPSQCMCLDLDCVYGAPTWRGEPLGSKVKLPYSRKVRAPGSSTTWPPTTLSTFSSAAVFCELSRWWKKRPCITTRQRVRYPSSRTLDLKGARARTRTETGSGRGTSPLACRLCSDLATRATPSFLRGVPPSWRSHVRREAIVIAVHVYSPDEIQRRTDEEREIQRQNAIIVDQVLSRALGNVGWL